MGNVADSIRFASSEAGLPRSRTRVPQRHVMGAAAAFLRPYLIIAPALVFLLLFTYFPLVKVVVGSLYQPGFAGAPATFAGLANYRAVFLDPSFQRALLNNVIYGLGTTVPSIALALLLALWVRRSTRLNRWLRAALFFPALVPMVAAATLWSFLFMPQVGLIDYYLGKFGLPGVSWLGSPYWAIVAIILVTIWKNAGYYMLFFLAGLTQIPSELEEAATLDGATAWQRLRHIVLPLLRPTLLFVVVIAALYSVTQVDQVIVMTQGGPSDATNLLLYYVYENAYQFGNTGKAMATTVLIVGLLVALMAICFRTLGRSGGTHDARE